MSDDNTEIRNKELLGGLTTEKNSDGSPVQEIVGGDGEVKGEIRNSELLCGLVTEKNADGTPVKEITSAD